jgi:tetratricopeptide (TPR) repeat protein
VTIIDIQPALRKAAFAAGILLLAVSHWYVGKWGLGNMVSTRADTPEIADVAVDMAPGDPQTHYAAAVLYDKTFVASDQQRSLAEYETAAALSPNNYILWLAYGRALERSGDTPRGEIALERALALAPNYGSVQWALGNLQVRSGETDAGFEQIRKAVEGDQTYAGAAASFAYQFFDGDLDRTRNVVGSSPYANANLALLLIKQKRFEDAYSVWRSIDRPDSIDSISAAGRALVNELLSAKKFDVALRVNSSLQASASAAPEKIFDGGFEDAVKLEGTTPFEWQIGPGAQPQVLQSTSQPHGGSRSLVLRFSSNDGSGLRTVTQTVVIRPSSKYTFDGYFHTDVKSDEKIVWQVIDTVSGSVLAELPLESAYDWTPFRTVFQTPAGTEAVILQLTGKGCGSAICPISGSLWLDDLELTTL